MHRLFEIEAGQFQNALSIYAYKPDVLKALKQAQCLVLRGSPGTGQSLLQALLVSSTTFRLITFAACCNWVVQNVLVCRWLCICASCCQQQQTLHVWRMYFALISRNTNATYCLGLACACRCYFDSVCVVLLKQQSCWHQNVKLLQTTLLRQDSFALLSHHANAHQVEGAATAEFAVML